MLYLIGLGLNIDGISAYGLKVVQQCKKVYLESYTVDLPYFVEGLEKIIEKKITIVDREFVESLRIVDEAKKQDVALLVYGSPLVATTHITLVQEAKLSGVRCKVIHAASIIDAVAETGLQLYKFGKIASIPKHEADSFTEVIKDNQKINAHTLLLVDIGLDFGEALDRLEKVKIDKIVVCSRLGMGQSEIIYEKIGNLEGREVQKPYCIIIPGKLHFLEEEVLKSFSQ